MSLEKLEVIDLIEVLEDGILQVRKATRIMEDGVELSKSYHRHVIHPGADLTDEDTKVKKLAKAMWTDAVVAAYKAKLEQ